MFHIWSQAYELCCVGSGLQIYNLQTYFLCQKSTLSHKSWKVCQKEIFKPQKVEWMNFNFFAIFFFLHFTKTLKNESSTENRDLCNVSTTRFNFLTIPLHYQKTLILFLHCTFKERKNKKTSMKNFSCLNDKLLIADTSIPKKHITIFNIKW